MSSSVLNVGKQMRLYSGKYRVSPAAVGEMISRLDMWFEMHMKDIYAISKSHGRSTVFDDDVTEFFSVTKNCFKDE